MKKLFALALCLIVLLGSAACGQATSPAASDAQSVPAGSAPPQAASNADLITIVLSDINNEDSSLGQASAMFAQLVGDRSNGRINVQTYFSGQLGDEAENVKNLASGVVGITRVSVANLPTRGIDVPEYKLFGLPYLIRSQTHAASFFSSEDAQRLAAKVEEVTNGEIVSLDAYIVASPRHFFAKTPIASMSDMSGMKVRSETSEVKTDTMEAFGMSPTPLALNDMYSALQTGMIVGGEHNLANIKSYAFYEQCPYVLLTGHNYNVNVYLISGAVWSKLSAEDQQLIQTAIREACDWCTEYSMEEDAALRTELEGEGVTFTEPQDLDVWQGAAQSLYDKYAAGYEEFVETVLSYDK